MGDDQIKVLSGKAQQGDQAALSELKNLASTPGEFQARAAFRLGLLHDSTGPMGTLNNLETARGYYRQSAELGYPRAEFFLGNMYEFGEGAPQDWATARDWYERAAQKGEVNSQMNLARILQTGRGGFKDVEAAAFWYLQAATNGDEQAATNLAMMHLHGELKSPDMNLVIGLLEFAVTKLDGVACLELGRLYLEGREVEQSYENALIHLFLAEQLLKQGGNLDITKEYLAALLNNQDLSVRDFYVERAKAYINHVRGNIQ